MTTFNSKGFVVRRADGRLMVDSAVSAYSRRRAVTHSVLEPVDGVSGLYVRLTRKDDGQITPAQRAHVHDEARAWYASAFGPPSGVAFATPESRADGESTVTADDPPGIDDHVPPGDDHTHPDESPSGVAFATPESRADGESAVTAGDLPGIDAVTLEDLQARARALEIPGRSRMDKAALFAAVSAAEAGET